MRDWLLGPRCRTCGQRVFPKDEEVHDEVNHPGEADTTVPRQVV